MSTADLSVYLEQPLTVTGIAQDALAGAVVAPSGVNMGTPIYVAGLESWGEHAGRLVSVYGVLRRRPVIPIATVDADGLINHGLESAVFVLDEPSWEPKT